MTAFLTTGDEVLQRLKRVLPRLAVLLEEDRPFAELGLDSMDTVELLCAIHEEFGIRLTESEFSLSMRPAELTAVIAAGKPLNPSVP